MKDYSFFLMFFSCAKTLVTLPPSTTDFCNPRNCAANYLTSKILLNCSLTGVVHTTRESSACTTISIYLCSTSAGAAFPSQQLSNTQDVTEKCTSSILTINQLFFSCLAQEVLSHYIHLNGVWIESDVRNNTHNADFFFLLLFPK